MAISHSLSVDPNVSGAPKGVDMWAAAIAQGTADAAKAGEAHVTHRPGVPGVVCGTLNLLGEDFNPFEFIATGDKEFMGKFSVCSFSMASRLSILRIGFFYSPRHARAISPQIFSSTFPVQSHVPSASTGCTFSRSLTAKEYSLQTLIA
jgi:hypothetical protein